MRVSNVYSECARSHTSFCRDAALLLVSLVALEVVGLVPPAAAVEISCPCTKCECALAHSPGECHCASNSFIVRSFVDGPAAADVAKHCETLCAHLRSNLFGKDDPLSWTPKCAVVLHPTRQAYRTAVGAGGNQTIGASSIVLGGGRVTERRIDLMAADVQQGLAALPHEMVHVLFADAFPTTPPPKWAEEGLALLMDPADKQSRHRRDLATALRSRSTLPLDRLLADADYPSPAMHAAFYAQSLSLVEYLTQRGTPRQFVRFVERAVEQGNDSALSTVYGIDSRELSRDWWQKVSGIQLAGAE